MSVVSECVGAAVPHELKHKGRTYRFSHVTKELKSLFEKRMLARAKEGAAALRDLRTPEEHAERIDRLEEDYRRGRFALESRHTIEALRRSVDEQIPTPEVMTLVSLIAGVDEMELITLLGERREEVTSLMKLVLRESFPQEQEREEGPGEPAGDTF